MFAAVAVATGPASPATAAPLPAILASQVPPLHTWPEYSHDPQLSGMSPDGSISTANASSLGVSWMANMGASALASPVVAWNAADRATLIYTSNEAGYLIAFDAATHEPVWSMDFGAGMRSTPLVEGNYLWVAPTSAHRIYKLDAGTGAVRCSAPLAFNTDASPTIGTPPGGSPTIYEGVNDRGPNNGPMTAIDEATCAVDFSVNWEPVAGTGGIWDPASYAVDAHGEGLVLYGTADPDAAVYAIDAITGQLVWRFATDNPAPHIYDVGAGVSVSPPGVNGVSDGIAYAVNKDGYLYALDLTTGAVLWSQHFQGTISTPTLTGSDLVYGDGKAVTCLNAVTGATVWQGPSGSAVDGAVTVVGPSGSQVVVYGGMDGVVHALSLATGAQLFSYSTGNFIVSNIAEYDGNLVVTSADGFLYDFAPGGGNGSPPATIVTSPANGTSIANPGGSLTISGKAGGAGGPSVGAVSVAIQQGGAIGPWWDSASGTWTAAPFGNPATVSGLGASTSDWTLTLPVPQSGGSYQVFASAIGTNGVADISAEQSPPTPARIGFSVAASTTEPTLKVSSKWAAPVSQLTVRGSGFQGGESVVVALAGSTVVTVHAGTGGSLPAASFTVPTSVAFGLTTLTATGQTSGRSTSTPVYITNSWSQFRSTASRLGSEANDSILADHLAVGSGTFLTQAWSFNSAAAIEGSPAVVDAMAYFGNTAGNLYAVNVQTGMEKWVHPDDGASPINSSPAVDPDADGGLVIFATRSGAVNAVHISSGKLAWSAVLGSGIDSSPAVSNGTVYIGTDAGSVYALNEATGQTIWHTNLAGPVHSSPAVATNADYLVVGDNSGAVTELSASTGAEQWSVQLSTQPVVATPILAGKDLYVGSENGTLYALAQSTGAKIWTAFLGGSIAASAALSDSTLVAGTTTGILTDLNPATGHSTLTQHLTGAVVGVSNTIGFSVAETAEGVVSGSKGSGRGGWTTRLPAGLSSSPTIVNGEVFVTGLDGMLHCYTIPGNPPV
jgi:outer membrane protein assembly factor BamB